MGRAQHSITQLFHFPDVLGKPASIIGSEFPKSWYRAPALRSAPSRCPKPSLALTPAAVGLMYTYTNNRGRAVGADLAGAIRVLSGRGYADFHAGANFAITEFYEVRRFHGALACFGAIAHIHSPQTGVSCVRYVAKRPPREGAGPLPAHLLDEG